MKYFLSPSILNRTFNCHLQIGNGVLNAATDAIGYVDYTWTHALISHETYKGILQNCDLVNGNFSKKCNEFYSQASDEIGNIDYYNIYAPICHNADIKKNHKTTPTASVSLRINVWILIFNRKLLHQVITLSFSCILMSVDNQTHEYDPCSDYYVESYLNTAAVQSALHAKHKQWSGCRYMNYID